MSLPNLGHSMRGNATSTMSSNLPAGALSTLSCELERQAAQWQAGGALSNSVELAAAAGAMLEAAACICGALPRLGAPVVDDACVWAEADKQFAKFILLLHLEPVSRSFRDFVGRLLNEVLVCVPMEHDLHSWRLRPRISRFLESLFSHSSRLQTAPVTAVIKEAPGEEDSRPCANCQCRQIILQEVLAVAQKFLKSVRATYSCDAKWADAVNHQPELYHMEDGFAHLLELLKKALEGLHRVCYLAVHSVHSSGGDQGAQCPGLGNARRDLLWKPLMTTFLDGLLSGPALPLFTGPSIVRTARTVHAAMHELLPKAAKVQRPGRRRRKPRAGFASFPPACRQIAAGKANSLAAKGGA